MTMVDGIETANYEVQPGEPQSSFLNREHLQPQ